MSGFISSCGRSTQSNFCKLFKAEIQHRSRRIQTKYKLEIKPAINPADRHKIQAVLEKMGYWVHSGGTHTDMTACDIVFYKEEKE